MISSGAVSLKGSEAISAVDDDVAAATVSSRYHEILAMFSFVFQMQSQVTLQQALPPDVRRRNQELNEIANSISQLGDLFKDLSALVIDQGTLLDSVEYNIEQTSVHVAEAARELTVATKSVPDSSSGDPQGADCRSATDIRRTPVGESASSYSLSSSLGSSSFSYLNPAVMIPRHCPSLVKLHQVQHLYHLQHHVDLGFFPICLIA